MLFIGVTRSHQTEGLVLLFVEEVPLRFTSFRGIRLRPFLKVACCSAEDLDKASSRGICEVASLHAMLDEIVGNSPTL
jgi:hypothetical protein